MRETLALMRVNLLGMLTSFSNNKQGKKKASGALIVLLMGGLSVYISVVYSLLLAQSLQPVGLLELLPILMAVVACAASLMFASMGASGIVFGGRDMDLLFSLPVSAFSVMLSKLLALYLENLIFNVFLLIPAGVIYLVYGGGGGVLFCMALMISTLFLSLLSTLLSAVVGFFLALIQSRSQGKALVTNLVYLVFLALVFVAAFQINQAVGDIAAHQGAIEGALGSWLLPFGLLRLGLAGSLPAYLGFAAITLVPFLLAVWLFSRFYTGILTRLLTHSSRSDYRLGSLAAGSQFSALLKKEAGRFFGTPIYLFNLGIGAMMALAGSIFAAFQRDALQLMLAQIPGVPAVLLVAAALSFLFLMTVPACASISLEGKYLWILKEAPIRSSTLFLVKALLNALLIWGPALLCLPLLWYGFSLTPQALLALFCLCASLGCFVPCFGLAFNLRFPKMDAVNDTLVVKQSASTMIGVFASMLIPAAAALVYWKLGTFLAAESFLLCCSGLFLVLAAVLWHWVLKKGPGILKEL